MLLFYYYYYTTITTVQPPSCNNIYRPFIGYSIHLNYSYNIILLSDIITNLIIIINVIISACRFIDYYAA